jgi:hypothetical protein
MFGLKRFEPNELLKISVPEEEWQTDRRPAGLDRCLLSTEFVRVAEHDKVWSGSHPSARTDVHIRWQIRSFGFVRSTTRYQNRVSRTGTPGQPRWQINCPWAGQKIGGHGFLRASHYTLDEKSSFCSKNVMNLCGGLMAPSASCPQ